MRILEVASPDCVADNFNGEIVALNLKTGIYFSFRDLAASIWLDLMAGHSVEALIHIATNFDKKFVDEIEGFIKRVLAEGLMREKDGIVSEPQILPAIFSTLSSGITQILIESYSDMQDLVMTDPIHDADENEGWPVEKPTVSE